MNAIESRVVSMVILCLGIVDRVDAGISPQNELNPIGQLKKSLFHGFIGTAGPSKNYAAKIPVNLGLSIKQLELNDDLQKMTIYCNLILSWHDDYLLWNSTAYRNVNLLSFDTEEIWKPRIALYNGVHKTSMIPAKDWPIWVTSDGIASWSPDLTATVNCKMDLYYWPSDMQKCIFKFASWADEGVQIDLILNKNGSINGNNLLLDNFEANRQWRLVRYATKKENTKTNSKYAMCDAIVTVKRNGVARMKYITHSTAAVLIVVLLAYVIPVSFHLSRILMHLFALAMLIICDIIIFITLPNSGGQVPLIVNYYSGTIVLTTVSLAIHCIMISLYFNSKSQKILRKRISLMWPFSKYTRAVSEEVGYIHLSEEVASEENQTGDSDNTDNRISGAAHIIESQLSNDQPAKQTAKITLIKTVNATLFFIFAIAFTIDYAAMISMISNA